MWKHLNLTQFSPLEGAIDLKTHETLAFLKPWDSKKFLGISNQEVFKNFETESYQIPIPITQQLQKGQKMNVSEPNSSITHICSYNMLGRM